MGRDPEVQREGIAEPQYDQACAQMFNTGPATRTSRTRARLCLDLGELLTLSEFPPPTHNSPPGNKSPVLLSLAWYNLPLLSNNYSLPIPSILCPKSLPLSVSTVQQSEPPEFQDTLTLGILLDQKLKLHLDTCWAAGAEPWFAVKLRSGWPLPLLLFPGFSHLMPHFPLSPP